MEVSMIKLLQQIILPSWTAAWNLLKSRQHRGSLLATTRSIFPLWTASSKRSGSSAASGPSAKSSTAWIPGRRPRHVVLWWWEDRAAAKRRSAASWCGLQSALGARLLSINVCWPTTFARPTTWIRFRWWPSYAVWCSRPPSLISCQDIETR